MFLTVEVDDQKRIGKLVEMSEKLNPSWKATEESLLKLEQYSNRGSEIENDDELFTLLQDFAKDAFRDLSSVRDDGEAMEVFHKLASDVIPTYGNGEDIFVWAKSVKERPGGSGIVVLHVTDLERFRQMIEDHEYTDNNTVYTTLENGIQIGS